MPHSRASVAGPGVLIGGGGQTKNLTKVVAKIEIESREGERV
jgi:hypothetical protein